MIVSEARLAANRLNALRSTGPRTAEGKERSRANALKHGMCAATLAVAGSEPGPAAEARGAAWGEWLRPSGDAEAWLVREIAATSLRIDHAERVERQARDRAALRAEVCWDDDRRLAAETLGAGLSKAPGEVVERLKATPQGCDWLIKRWALLVRAGQEQKDLTADQKAMAFDLLGTPAGFRGGCPAPPPDPDGPPTPRWTCPIALARREIESLRAHRDRVVELDEVERGLAGADLADDASPELRRLRRHEATLHKRLRWCLDQLRAEPRTAAPKVEAEAEPMSATRPEPDPAAEPSAPRPEPDPAAEPEPPPEVNGRPALPRDRRILDDRGDRVGQAGMPSPPAADGGVGIAASPGRIEPDPA